MVDYCYFNAIYMDILFWEYLLIQTKPKAILLVDLEVYITKIIPITYALHFTTMQEIYASLAHNSRQNT